MLCNMDFPYTAKDDVEERKDWARMKVTAVHIATILSVKKWDESYGRNL
jgi:hypothetical protein